jgi:hypothetical protein
LITCFPQLAAAASGVVLCDATAKTPMARRAMRERRGDENTIANHIVHLVNTCESGSWWRQRLENDGHGGISARQHGSAF